jgi:hypothetical protein
MSRSRPDESHIQAGGLAKGLTLADADDATDEDLDTVYLTKFRGSAARIIDNRITHLGIPRRPA